ncbi:MAG: Uma2 family endonuclease [Gemmatimonadetes bacterium]|nr:Uma2 family endonuclease [Gemmatimonadota bacterium]
MAMPFAPAYHTAEMVRAIPDDGNRYELVHGELLVTPSPRPAHQRIVMALAVQLWQFCREHGAGEVLSSPADISWGSDTLVQPDLFVVAPREAGGRTWSEIRALDLVVEVLSPSTAKQDRFQKRKLYQLQGVGTLWLVDAEAKQVEVWTPDAAFPRVETVRVTWAPPGRAVSLMIELNSIFE